MKLCGINQAAYFTVFNSNIRKDFFLRSRSFFRLILSIFINSFIVIVDFIKISFSILIFLKKWNNFLCLILTVIIFYYWLFLFNISCLIRK